MLPRRLSNNVAYASAGSMTERVTLVQLSESRTATGAIVNTHEPVATVWARIDALTSKYTEKTEEVITEATHRVSIRWMSGITSANLVALSDGRVWNIQAALDPDERRVQLDLYCYERN
jgi:SPP1 family predicted phage head-tail adaptor